MKKQNDSPHIITQYAASQIPGMPSKQNFNAMFHKNNSMYSFFTPDGKIDTSHPDWETYQQERKSSTWGIKSAEKKAVGVNERKSEDGAGKKKSDGKVDEKDSGWRREHALTGGYNPAGFYPTNPGQLKSMTEVTRMNLEMRIKLQEYIQKDIVDSYIDRIAQGINQFVNLGRTVSNPICQKLDRMGMEKEVEKIIGGKVKGIIEQIIKICNNVSGKEFIPAVDENIAEKKKRKLKK